MRPPTPQRVKARAQRAVRQSVMRYARWRGDLLLELFDPGNWGDPMPIYQRMREKGPVIYSRIANAYVLTTYEDSAAALRDTRFSARRPEGKGDEHDSLGSPDSLLHLDPPRHTQVKKLMTKGFSLRAIEGMTGWVDEVVHELLDNLVGRQELDFVAEFAFPLPARVVSHVLGVPDSDQHKLREWGETVGPTLDPFMTPAQHRAARAAAREMIDYFRALVAERKQAPRENDIVTNLIRARDDDDGVRLTDGELLATCQLMLVAGFGTSVGMLASIVHLFVDRPDLWTKLRENRDLVPQAVEEALRLESPVQLTLRILTEPVQIGGKKLPKGARVFALMGGGNRDPRMFPQPDEVDLSRDNAARHLAFSPGIHHCLGAPLARLEGRLALNAMLDRMPEIRRGGPSKRLPHLNARIIGGLPIAVEPAVLERSGVQSGV